MLACADVCAFYVVLCVDLCIISLCLYVVKVPLIASTGWHNLLSQENLCACVCVHGLSHKLKIVDTNKPLVVPPP